MFWKSIPLSYGPSITEKVYLTTLVSRVNILWQEMGQARLLLFTLPSL